MATFDPSKHQKVPDSDSGVPAGDYLLIIKSFSRKAGKDSGKPYLRTLFKVIHGPAKDRTFFDSLSLDMNNSGAMFRLSMLAEQCGSGAFDLDRDSEIRDALANKPFKARVSREVSGQYINNGIARYLGKEITDFERRVMDTWLVDYAENQQFGGGGGGGRSGDGVDGDGLPDGNVPPPSDDDIPF
jgi:hypothetical protein